MLSSLVYDNNEETQIIQLGLSYAFEKPTKHYIQDMIIDTEHAIRQLDEDEQNIYIYRHLACKKIKQIQDTTFSNTLYKRQNYIAKTDTATNTSFHNWFTVEKMSIWARRWSFVRRNM